MFISTVNRDTPTCAYQEVQNVSFSFENVLNEWSLSKIKIADITWEFYS